MDATIASVPAHESMYPYTSPAGPPFSRPASTSLLSISLRETPHSGTLTQEYKKKTFPGAGEDAGEANHRSHPHMSLRTHIFLSMSLSNYNRSGCVDTFSCWCFPKKSISASSRAAMAVSLVLPSPTDCLSWSLLSSITTDGCPPQIWDEHSWGYYIYIYVGSELAGVLHIGITDHGPARTVSGPTSSLHASAVPLDHFSFSFSFADPFDLPFAKARFVARCS